MYHLMRNNMHGLDVGYDIEGLQGRRRVQSGYCPECREQYGYRASLGKMPVTECASCGTCLECCPVDHRTKS